MANKGLAPNDTAWFDGEPGKYLLRNDFQNFQDVSGVDFTDLLSKDFHKVKKAQDEIVAQSMIFNEIRSEHAGYLMPLLYYTHDFNFARPLLRHNPELEKIVLAFDQGDSLRRRHIALSYVLLPKVLADLSEQFKQPLIVKNLGSGIGLDIAIATKQNHKHVGQVLNYDINQNALKIGEQVVSYLEKNHEIKKGILQYKRQGFLEPDKNEKAHLSILVGVICGLTDKAALIILRKIYKGLHKGGKLLLTCANHHMMNTDPLANFLIQHIGTEENPFNGWGLNFRKMDTLKHIFISAGFKEFEIHDDFNYEGVESLPKKKLFGIETLPSNVFGHNHTGEPIALPNKEVLEKRIGYNWIAVATK